MTDEIGLIRARILAGKPAPVRLQDWLWPGPPQSICSARFEDAAKCLCLRWISQPVRRKLRWMLGGYLGVNFRLRLFAALICV